MRFGLWMALFAMCSAAHAGEVLSEIQLWQKTSLSSEFASRFINNEKCKSSLKYLQSCQAAITAAQALLPRPIIPPGYPDFEAALRAIEEMLPSDIPAQMMRAHAINAHLAVFDPYAAIKATAELKATHNSRNKQYVGIGIAVEPSQQGIVIREVYPNSPAQRAGLKDGDQILAVASDGKNFENAILWSQDTLAVKVVGEAGQPIAMKLLRNGQEITSPKIKRGPVKVKYVLSEVLNADERIGYLRIRSFESWDVDMQVKEHMDALQSKQIKKLILDLRGNQGGDKTMAVNIAELFLGRHKVTGVKSVENSVPSIAEVMRLQTEKIDPEIQWEGGFVNSARYTLPMVVLIDSSSASGAEILAGALQDHNRAWVIGERSYGKGSAQSIEPVPRIPSLSLKWTTERFYQPSGRTNQGIGISPSFEIPRSRSTDLSTVVRKRESDLVPNSLSSESTRWIETRPDQVKEISSCVNEAGVRADIEDFQKAYGMTVLNCGS